MMTLLLVFVGSAIGGFCRYVISNLVFRASDPGFPVGTLVVNVSGALCLGIAWELFAEDSSIREFLMLGVLGGYTTVSSFALQTMDLMHNGDWMRAMLNVFASVLLCLVAVAGGSALASWI